MMINQRMAVWIFLGVLAFLLIVGLSISMSSSCKPLNNTSNELTGATACVGSCCKEIVVEGHTNQPDELRSNIEKALAALDKFHSEALQRDKRPNTASVTIGESCGKFRARTRVRVCGRTNTIMQRGQLAERVEAARADLIKFFETRTGQSFRVKSKREKEREVCSDAVYGILPGLSPGSVKSYTSLSNRAIFIGDRGNRNEQIATSVIAHCEKEPVVTIGGSIVSQLSFVKTNNANEWRLDVDLFTLHGLPFYGVMINLKEAEANFKIDVEYLYADVEFLKTYPIFVARKGDQVLVLTNSTPVGFKWVSVFTLCENCEFTRCETI
jgi:hypothetical protein